MLIFAASCWASSSIAGRFASGNVPPMTLSFLRWALAFAIFLPFAVRPFRRQTALVARHFPLLIAFSFFGVVGFTVPYYVGLQFTQAMNVAILNASGPAWTVLCSFAMLGILISLRQSVGLAIAVCGTLWIMVRGDLSALAGFQLYLGDILTLSAFFSWAIYTVMLRFKPPEFEEFTFLISIVGIGCLIMLPMYLWELNAGLRFDPVPANFFIIGYAALFPSVIGYILWNRAVPVVGANIAAFTQYMIPVFGVLFSISLLGETLRTYHIVGIAAVFAGIYLCTGQRKPQKTNEALDE